MNYALIVDRAGVPTVQEVFTANPNLHDDLDVRQVGFDVAVGDVVRQDGTVGPKLLTKPELKAYAASKRWRVQTSGNGSGLPTDDASRAAVAQAIQSIDIGILPVPVRWKTAAGFEMLTRAQLLAIAQAMAAHVQAAFNAEAVVVQRIDAGTITTVAAIDAATWPTSG